METPPDRLSDANAVEIGAEARKVAQVGRLGRAFAKMAGLAGFDPEEVEAGLRADFEAEGTIDANVIVRVLPAGDVESLLPRGLELAPQIVVPSDQHPIVVMFNHDHFRAWFGEMRYHEVLVAVPFVQRTDTHVPQRGPFVYMPRLYLDETLPRLLGNLLYGYEKLDANIEVADGRWTVRERNGDPIAALSVTPAGEPVSASRRPELDAIRALLEQPTVSQATRIFDPRAFHRDAIESAFICSNIRYLFDDPGATVQPIRAELQFQRRFSPRHVPTDVFAAPSLSEHPFGAFRLRAPIRVSMPGSCADTEYPRSLPSRRRRIVVLGGGPAACAAAFYLGQQPERYEVSLYTMGWRLGGKCAAGRNVDAAERIEEHGLHAFLGFYENAIRTMREVWATAGLDISRGQPPWNLAGGEGPIANAFQGKLDVGLVDVFRGEHRYFATGQRLDDREPGLIPGREGDRLPAFGEVMLAVLARIRIEVRELVELPGGLGERLAESLREAESDTLWERFLRTVDRAIGLRENTVAEALERLVDHVQELAIERVADDIARGAPVFRAAAWLLHLVRGALRRDYDDAQQDADAWFRWSNLDVVLTVAIGILESRAIRFDTLDRFDFREWLLAHGMDPRNRDISTVRMVYDTLFANADDEPVRTESLAAGVALRWFLLTGFGFRGFPAYDMRYSCPQTLFTPYLIALRHLGVKVHFFHRVDALRIEGRAPDRRLTAIALTQQASVTAGTDAYRPFAPPIARRDPPGLPDWPSAPDWAQLDGGAALREMGIDLEDPSATPAGARALELRQGVDFDACVLGIPLGPSRRS